MAESQFLLSPEPLHPFNRACPTLASHHREASRPPADTPQSRMYRHPVAATLSTPGLGYCPTYTWPEDGTRRHIDLPSNQVLAGAPHPRPEATQIHRSPARPIAPRSHSHPSNVHSSSYTRALTAAEVTAQLRSQERADDITAWNPQSLHHHAAFEPPSKHSGPPPLASCMRKPIATPLPPVETGVYRSYPVDTNALSPVPSLTYSSTSSSPSLIATPTKRVRFSLDEDSSVTSPSDSDIPTQYRQHTEHRADTGAQARRRQQQQQEEQQRLAEARRAATIQPPALPPRPATREADRYHHRHDHPHQSSDSDSDSDRVSRKEHERPRRRRRHHHHHHHKSSRPASLALDRQLVETEHKEKKTKKSRRHSSGPTLDRNGRYAMIELAAMLATSYVLS